MSDRALSRTPSQSSALLAKLTKPRSRAPRVVGELAYLVGLVAFLTWPSLHRFSGARA